MLKLKLQYFGHLMRGTNSLEKILMLGKIEGGKRWGRQRIRWLNGITNTMDMRLNELQELVMNRKDWRIAKSTESQRVIHDWATGLNWTECYPEGNGISKRELYEWRCKILKWPWVTKDLCIVFVHKLQSRQCWPFPQKQLVKPECTSLSAHNTVADFKPTYK